MLQHGCKFSEFGTRRRRDYKTQDIVMRGLIGASREIKNATGSLMGTSNVHFAMKYKVTAIGTVAHEWFMGIAAATGGYKAATETALQCWLDCFGSGVLGIALTDTFGTKAFLEAFSKPAQVLDKSPTDEPSKSFAELFAGVRQDSGDPSEFIKTMRTYYDGKGISKATMVFSDSLNIDLCKEYKRLAEEEGFEPSFGIGTYLTSKQVALLRSKYH